MRMASALPTLLAVLCGAVVDAGDVIGNVSDVSRERRTPAHHYSHRVKRNVEQEISWKRSHWKEMQNILRTEGGGSEGVQCCPSVLEMVTMKGGRTPKGLYVELYEDGENQQILYEVSCLPSIVNKPCRFIDARLSNDSRCVQKYSYSYALVRHVPSATETPKLRTEGQFSVPGSGGWSMDYVRVRAGCECEVNSTKQRRRHKQRKRNRRIIEREDS